MVAKSPEGIGANVKIFLGHFQKCLTVVYQEKKVFPGGASGAGLGSPIRGSMAGSGFLGLTDRELALEMVGYL